MDDHTPGFYVTQAALDPAADGEAVLNVLQRNVVGQVIEKKAVESGPVPAPGEDFDRALQVIVHRQIEDAVVVHIRDNHELRALAGCKLLR